MTTPVAALVASLDDPITTLVSSYIHNDQITGAGRLVTSNRGN
jgi:hypothetical protein